MPDNEDKTKRAAELEAAIKEHDAKKRADEEHAGQKLDRMLSSMDDYFKKMDAMAARMDALEDDAKKARDDTKRKRKYDDTKRKGDDDDAADGELVIKHGDGDDDHEPFAEQPTPDMAKPIVADSHRTRADAERRHETLMADAQARADAVAVEFGEKSPPPLSNERLGDYKRRLLRRYLRFSPDFKDVDLYKITDAATFSGIENRVYSDAVKAAGSPEVGAGQLRMITKRLPSGHTENRFVGSPLAWLNPMMPVRSYVVGIKTKFD